jgi:hypothetical protein
MLQYRRSIGLVCNVQKLWSRICDSRISVDTCWLSSRSRSSRSRRCHHAPTTALVILPSQASCRARAPARATSFLPWCVTGRCPRPQCSLTNAVSLQHAPRLPRAGTRLPPVYTQWTDTIPVDLGGFSVEIGHALEAVCGVKVEFILDSWSACWTEKPARIYFRRTAHHTPCHPYHTHVHNKASPLSPCARVQRGERVPGRKHHERPRPRLHRVHAHQGGARPLARVHALHPKWSEDSWHPHAPRALRARPPCPPQPQASRAAPISVPLTSATDGVACLTPYTHTPHANALTTCLPSSTPSLPHTLPHFPHTPSLSSPSAG